MTEIPYRHQKTSVSLINYNFVLVTYEGRKLLIGRVKESVERLIQSKVKELNCVAIALVVNPESVHLFVNSHPDLSPKTIMRQIKGFTSYTLRQQFPDLKKFSSVWSPSYLVSTGVIFPEMIQKYTESQIKEFASKSID
jgi:putative transposase